MQEQAETVRCGRGNGTPEHCKIEGPPANLEGIVPDDLALTPIYHVVVDEEGGEPIAKVLLGHLCKPHALELLSIQMRAAFRKPK